MGYYQPCPEYDECNRLINEYFETKQYEKCFQGHLPLAEKGYPLAECQFNLACFYEEGIGTGIDMEAAKVWYGKAAKQNHDLAIKKCHELKIDIV